MYLSKVTLAPSCDMANILLKLQRNGAYSSHQLLWQLFTQEEQRQFIFRQEQAVNGLPTFFVLSLNEPSLNSDIFQVKSKEFEPKLHEGQRLAFKLRVNPTICITDTNGHSKRHDVLMHAKYQMKHENGTIVDVKRHMDQAAHQWICDEKRLEHWGMQLDSLPEIEAYTQHKTLKKLGHRLQFSSVDFQGVLTLTQPEKFLSQYANGFGRAKALGCGLMLIRSI
ncbi:type I-E CRISPR-associated protein Cas6/Cse3/CasE [Shewanella sp.]|nr:type I-E CRISPR-associated protein Cas6/Cse3/CasE [Shewanella sp.]